MLPLVRFTPFNYFLSGSVDVKISKVNLGRWSWKPVWTVTIFARESRDNFLIELFLSLHSFVCSFFLFIFFFSFGLIWFYLVFSASGRRPKLSIWRHPLIECITTHVTLEYPTLTSGVYQQLIRTPNTVSAVGKWKQRRLDEILTIGNYVVLGLSLLNFASIQRFVERSIELQMDSNINFMKIQPSKAYICHKSVYLLHFAFINSALASTFRCTPSL